MWTSVSPWQQAEIDDLRKENDQKRFELATASYDMDMAGPYGWFPPRHTDVSRHVIHGF